MQRFDCTAQNCPLFGPHLLEASAGTGKTFAIEHVFVRLLLESEDPPIELEQILAVTFTRAAARELKMRVRSNLDRALAFLDSPTSSGWDYLRPFAESKEAMRRLSDARAMFDRCQIFTIHGFCYRMLMEFAFEAHLGFSLPDPDRGETISKQLKRAMRKFLETLSDELLCPEQIAILLKGYDSLDELSKALLKKGKAKREPLPFSESERQFCQAIRQWDGERPEAEKLWEDFQALEKGFKVAVKGNFQPQIFALAKALVSPEDGASLRTLIREKGSLFAFLAPSNRKLRASIPEHLLSFFEKASQTFAPILDRAVDQKTILETLVHSWQKEILEPWWNPDEILYQMKQAIELAPFAAKVREKYSAVIIDEFQDTDPLQWEIFRSLFLEQKKLRAFYLVGDPKQSIYRFRNADVYTYFEARDLLGKEALYSLDTNFRSSEKLLGVLNALFSKSRFELPKTNRSIPYQPVRAGAAIESSFGDGKGAVHAVFTNEGFEKALLPYAVGEIEKLALQVSHPGAFAILVKDRYQAEAALKALSARGIPAFAKSHTPLGQTEAFQALRELLEALVFPQDVFCTRIVEMGPFAHLPLNREVLREGLVPFFRDLGSIDFFNEADWKQVVEELLTWEQREGFSFEGLIQFLRDFEQLDSDEGGRRRLESDENAVQILTLHISKGLEFEVVFAFGLSSAQPEEEEEPEEIDAEKMRQLYVAMTRAKKRLYFPVRITSEAKPRSPMDLFCRHFEASYFQTLTEQESFTFEEIRAISLSPLAMPVQTPLELRDLKPVPYRPVFLYSFTALAQEKEKAFLPPQDNSELTIHSLPRGAETGIAIHQIFERLFSKETPVWRDPHAIWTLIGEELQFSSLKPWETPIVHMVQQLLSTPLFEGFTLKDLEPEMLQAEMEFLFAAPPHFVKGFIDLIFCWEGKYYMIDWKTNWLGDRTSDYHPAALEKAMQEHDYYLQAALYTEALQRHLRNFSPDPLFGGALYIFVRGNAVHHFQPDLNLLNQYDARSR